MLALSWCEKFYLHTFVRCLSATFSLIGMRASRLVSKMVFVIHLITLMLFILWFFDPYMLHANACLRVEGKRDIPSKRMLKADALYVKGSDGRKDTVLKVWLSCE